MISKTSIRANQWNLFWISIRTRLSIRKGRRIGLENSGATSNTILKTPHGFEAINSKRPLKYLSTNNKSKPKNKRQFSENQNSKISLEMMKIMHKHHLSLTNTNLARLDADQLKRLENAKDEEELIKEMSNFMEEPRELISMISMANRESYNPNKVANSVQLSTLSTNPKKRDKSKNKYEGNEIHGSGDMNFANREALIEDQSVIYDDEMILDEHSTANGPNEAMYFNVDPIPFNLMLSFEEAVQRQKEILDKSSKVNRHVMPVWDSRKHSKHKFYK